MAPRFWIDTFKLLFSSPWRYRALIMQLVRREVGGRYRGSVVGILWSAINPLFMLVVYTFVFSVVFKARWGVDSSESRTDFALILFVGLIVQGIFAECINRAPKLILDNVNLVKKIVFPLEILPCVALGTTLFHAAVSVLIWVAFFVAANTYLHWTILLLPIVLFPLALLSVGIGWFLSATGVYLRDIAQITGFVTTILLFVSPIFYPVSALPPRYRPLFAFNPLTLPVEQAREVMVWGHLPNFSALAVYFIVSLVVAAFGLAWFQKTRKGFADVL